MPPVVPLPLDGFFQIVALYCSFTRAQVLQFAFEAYDVDGNSVLDRDEVIGLCRTLNKHDPTFPGNFEEAVANEVRHVRGCVWELEFAEPLSLRWLLLLYTCVSVVIAEVTGASWPSRVRPQQSQFLAA